MVDYDKLQFCSTSGIAACFSFTPLYIFQKEQNGLTIDRKPINLGDYSTTI